MANLFLTDENLKNAIQSVKISQEQKDKLTAKIPTLNEEARKKLFDILKEITILDLEETDALGKIKKNWQE